MPKLHQFRSLWNGTPDKAGLSKPPRRKEFVWALILSAALGSTADAFLQNSAANPSAAEQIVENTNDWLLRYASQSTFQREALDKSAIVTAQRRREALALLIEQNPARAFDLRLGTAQRAGLPLDVIALLETLIDGTGDFLQFGTLVQQIEIQGQPLTQHLNIEESFLTVKGNRFPNPSRYGRRLLQESKEGIPVHAIAIDGHVAWSDLPLRVLDPVERLPYQAPPDSIVAISGDAPMILADLEALEARIKALILRELRPGPILPGPFEQLPPPPLPPDRSWTTGVQRLLVVPIDYSDLPGGVDTTSADFGLTLTEVRTWVETVSRGLVSFPVTVFPDVLHLPRTYAEYSRLTRSTLVTDGNEALASYDADHGGSGLWLPTFWGRVAFVARTGFPGATGIEGGAITGSSRYMAFWPTISHFTMSHEVGHTFLMPHAGMYLLPDVGPDPVPPDPATPAATRQYTVALEPWTYLGALVGGWPIYDLRRHPGSWDKNFAGWLAPGETVDASAGGSFRLYAHDVAPPGHLVGIRITADAVRDYWIDMRRLWPEFPELHSGVQLRFVDKRTPTDYQPAYHLLMDSRTVNPRGVFDSPYQSGDVFTDPYRHVTIRFGAVGTDAMGPYADITVERPGDQGSRAVRVAKR